MKILHVPMPEFDASNYREYDSSEIDVPADKVEVIAYWYGVGNYCGTGDAIYKAKDGLWDHADLGHCSCYGPEESIKDKGVYATWQELVATFSGELKEVTKDLVAALEATEPPKGAAR